MSTAEHADSQPTLKVMRLYKPKLHVSQPVPCAPAGVQQIAIGGIGGSPDLPDQPKALFQDTPFALSNFFILPDSFGNIYLGENFRGYVSVVNPCQEGGAGGARSPAGSPRVSGTPRSASAAGGGSVSPGSLTSSMGAMNAASMGAPQQSMLGATNVCLKAELHTERNRVLLYDSTQTPIARIDPGCSTDFVVDQDIKVRAPRRGDGRGGGPARPPG